MTLWEQNQQGFAILIACAVFALLAMVAVVLRLQSRLMTRQKVVFSDYAIIVSLVMAYGNMVVLGISVQNGLGRHLMELTPANILILVKTQIAITSIWIVNVTIVKLSILDLYIRIFQVPKFVKVVYFYMVFQVLFGIAGVLQITLLCRPIRFNWDKNTPGGVCGNREMAYFATHTIILVLDFGCAILPIPVLWKLQMTIQKKIGISIMFGIGIVICVFDLISITWRSKIDDPDFSYAFAVLYMFTLLEAELGILLACLPLCHPVARQFMASPMVSWSRAKIMRTFTGSRSQNTSDSSKLLRSNSRMAPIKGHQDHFELLPGENYNTGVSTFDANRLADLENPNHDGVKGKPDAIRIKHSWTVNRNA